MGSAAASQADILLKIHQQAACGQEQTVEVEFHRQAHEWFRSTLSGSSFAVFTAR